MFTPNCRNFPKAAALIIAAAITASLFLSSLAMLANSAEASETVRSERCRGVDV
jgi:uncharacterized membrane protein